MSKKETLKKWILRLSAILLPLSVVFTVVTLTLIMLGELRMPRFSVTILSLVPGIILWYAGILIKNRVRFYFAATFLLLTGVLLFLVDLNLMYISLRSIWPFLMFFISVSFLISGFYRYNKVHAMYIVPAAAFFLLGLVFLLFSTRIITVSLASVALWWFPLFFLPTLLTFILWLFRKKHTDRERNV